MLIKVGNRSASEDYKTAAKALTEIKKTKEQVNHPDHYQGKRLEAIDIIEDYDLNFSLGSVLKYILRAGKKDDKIQDLEKAKWYIEREIERCRNSIGD